MNGLGLFVATFLQPIQNFAATVSAQSKAYGMLHVSTDLDTDGLPLFVRQTENEIATKDPWVLLLEFTFNDNTQIFLAQSQKDITIGDTVYRAFNFNFDFVEESSGKTLTTLVLKVSNITILLESYLQNVDNLIGASVKMRWVYMKYPDYDTELEIVFDIIDLSYDVQWIYLTIGMPNYLRQNYPEINYLPSNCSHTFKEIGCSYVGKDIDEIFLEAAQPVVVQVVGHGFLDGDSIELSDVTGIEPSLDNTYIITKIDDNLFSLNNTNSSYCSGVFEEGIAGYSYCSKTLTACRQRENSKNWLGFVSLRAGTVVVV